MGKATEGATKESAGHSHQASPFFKSGGSRAPFFQAKSQLEVGAVNDPLETEADAMADRVVRRQTPAAHTKSSDGASAESAPHSVEQVVGTTGRALDRDLRNEMEQALQSDFSRVQLHSDAAAEQSARDVRAHAYTVGNHIVFGAGQLAPHTPQGKRLLAHELAHVVQQSGASTPTVQRAPDGSTDIDAPQDVEWKITEGSAEIKYGTKSTTIPLGSMDNSAKLVKELGITKPQASTVLRDIHANVPREDRLLISFVQNVGNPREYAIARFEELRRGALWHSDALARPPVEGIRKQVRVSGAGSTALELSEYGYVFYETQRNPFVEKPSGTAQGIQEFQHLNAAKARTAALTSPVAIVRVDEYGKIVEVVAHNLYGTAEDVRARLNKEFKKAGWKAGFGTPPAGYVRGRPDMRKQEPMDAHKPADMGKKPSPMDAHKPADMGKKPSPMDAHTPPDMGKKPSPMDAHAPPVVGGGGVTTVSRFRAAGQFLKREAPGLALQLVLMLIFPPGVIFRNDKLVLLSATKINPAAMDALAKQQVVFDKLLADDPSKSIYANMSIQLDYTVSASSHGDLILDLLDMTLVDVKISRDDIKRDSKFRETGRLQHSKDIVSSMLLYESPQDALIREYKEYQQCLQTPGVGQGAGAEPYSHCKPPRAKP